VLLTAAFTRAQSQSFFASTRDKHARAQAAQGPRMLFVGGSNVAFGMDCEQVRQRTAYEPVNLAVHASVGMDFMLSEGLSVARPGDVVVVSLEYGHLAGYMPEGKDLRALMHILLLRPQNARYLSCASSHAARQRLLVQPHRAPAARGPNPRARPDVRAAYRRDCFDLYGDVVRHRSMCFTPDRHERGRHAHGVEARVVDAVKRLNRFHAACQARGAFAFYVYPPIPDTSLASGCAGIMRTDRVLRERLTMPVLNRPGDVAWPLERFYDTCYHLTGEAATRRTDLLLESLAGNWQRWASDRRGPVSRGSAPASNRAPIAATVRRWSTSLAARRGGVRLRQHAPEQLGFLRGPRGQQGAELIQLLVRLGQAFPGVALLPTRGRPFRAWSRVWIERGNGAFPRGRGLRLSAVGSRACAAVAVRPNRPPLANLCSTPPDSTTRRRSRGSRVTVPARVEMQPPKRRERQGCRGSQSACWTRIRRV